MKLVSWSKSASAAAIALIMIAACSDDPLEPVPGRLDALYVATSVGGESLPRTMAFIDVTVTLVADTLRFSSDGSVTRKTVIRTVVGNLPQETFVSRAEAEGVYSIDGIRLTMGPKCGINELCAGWAGGTIIPSRVTLAYSALGDKAGELVLTRVE